MQLSLGFAPVRNPNLEALDRMADILRRAARLLVLRLAATGASQSHAPSHDKVITAADAVREAPIRIRR